MAKIRCANCGTENAIPTLGYCFQCGRDLPSTAPTSTGSEAEQTTPSTGIQVEQPRKEMALTQTPPREDFAADPMKAVFQEDELFHAEQKAKREVSHTLFAVAALQLVCGTILLVMVTGLNTLPTDQLPPAFVLIAVAEVIGIGLAFAGLGLWSRFQPLIPAVLGLILYGLLAALTILANPARANLGIIMKVIIILALVRAVRSAWKFEQLKATAPRRSRYRR